VKNNFNECHSFTAVFSVFLRSQWNYEKVNGQDLEKIGTTTYVLPMYNVSFYFTC